MISNFEKKLYILYVLNLKNIKYKKIKSFGFYIYINYFISSISA